MTASPIDRVRHPEKAARPDSPVQRKPDWIRVKAPGSPEYHATRRLMRELEAEHRLRGGGLPEYRRVLEGEARDRDDPGRRLHPRLHLLQRRDRAARPARPARAGAGRAKRWRKLGLQPRRRHLGRSRRSGRWRRRAFRADDPAIRAAAPATTIEVLTPDFLRKEGAIETVVAARPDVFNHNLETVPRLYADDAAGGALLSTRCACLTR